jgi:hypothetical protein
VVNIHNIKYTKLSQVWWCTLVIPALGRLRQEEQQLEASLGCIAILCAPQMTQYPFDHVQEHNPRALGPPTLSEATVALRRQHLLTCSNPSPGRSAAAPLFYSCELAVGLKVGRRTKTCETSTPKLPNVLARNERGSKLTLGCTMFMDRQTGVPRPGI